MWSIPGSKPISFIITMSFSIALLFKASISSLIYDAVNMFLLCLIQSFATIRWNRAGSIEITISAARISFALETLSNTSSFNALELE